MIYRIEFSKDAQKVIKKWKKSNLPLGVPAKFGLQVADQFGRKIFHLDMGQKIVALKLLPTLGSNFKEIYNMKRLTSEYPDFPILQVPLNYLEFCIKQDADLIRNIIQFLKLVASCNLLLLAKINLLTIQFRELTFEHEFMLLLSLLALFVISC